MWYICAMRIKGLAVFAVLLAITQAPAAVQGQTVAHPGANPSTNPGTTRQTSPSSTSSKAVPQDTGSPAVKTDCNGFPCDEQQPRIIVTLPAPAPTPWLLRDRIAWAANLVLAILGYIGIMLAVSMLRKIERQTRTAETAAKAAAESAQAALMNAQAVIDSERPWILIAVEPSLSVQNSFTVMATNRGRTPATIEAMVEQTKIAIDETHLPSPPDFENGEPSPPFVPIILLPGESSGIKTFSRDDVRGLCDSEERFKRVEDWEEKIFLYGKIIYRDLIAPREKQTHETNWCCWYIHGRQKSGLVVAGPPEYNVHT